MGHAAHNVSCAETDRAAGNPKARGRPGYLVAHTEGQRTLVEMTDVFIVAAY